MNETLKDGEGTQFPLSQVMFERALILLRASQPGELIKYSAIASAMEADPSVHHRARKAFLRATRRLLIEDKRAVENVRGVGYRVCKAGEHAMVSSKFERQSRRRMRKAVDVSHHVNDEELSPQERAVLVTIQTRQAIKVAVEIQIDRVAKKKSLPAVDEELLPNLRLLLGEIQKK